MTAVPSNMVKDPEYRNWIKVTLALHYMKLGLHTLIQMEVNDLHNILLQNIYGSQIVPFTACKMCHSSHVRRNKHSGVWAFPKQCRSYCDVWFYELLKLHTKRNSDKIYWNNSEVSLWPFRPWECAKVFMPKGQPASNAGPAECDIQALLTLLANCKYFHSSLSPQGLGLTRTISTIRNKIFHTGEMKVSDTETNIYMQQIIQLLEDPVKLQLASDCKAAVGNIQKIVMDSLDVVFNNDTEVRAFRITTHELRLEVKKQEKRMLDTDNDLKEKQNHIDELEKTLQQMHTELQELKTNVQNGHTMQIAIVGFTGSLIGLGFGFLIWCGYRIFIKKS